MAGSASVVHVYVCVVCVRRIAEMELDEIECERILEMLLSCCCCSTGSPMKVLGLAAYAEQQKYGNTFQS